MHAQYSILCHHGQSIKVGSCERRRPYYLITPSVSKKLRLINVKKSFQKNKLVVVSVCLFNIQRILLPGQPMPRLPNRSIYAVKDCSNNLIDCLLVEPNKTSK